MKNINAKKVLMFDKNILYTWNNATPSDWDTTWAGEKGFY